MFKLKRSATLRRQLKRQLWLLFDYRAPQGEKQVLPAVAPLGGRCFYTHQRGQFCILKKKYTFCCFFYKQFNFFLKVFKEFVILFGNGGRALPISFRIFVEIAGVSVVVDFGHDGRLQFAIINVVPVDTFEPAAWHKATIKFHLKFHLKYRANFESNDRISTLPALPLTVGSTPNGHHSIERNESNILLPFRNGCDRFRPR